MSEFVLQGESELTLDGKGRMTVPARHRDSLAALCAGQMTVTKSPSRCLLLFPRPAWEAFRGKLMGLPMDAESWRRIFIGSALDVEIDSGSRIQLSPELRRWAGLDRELVLVGMGTRMEIWDRGRHQALEDATLAQPMPDSVSKLVM